MILSLSITIGMCIDNPLMMIHAQLGHLGLTKLQKMVLSCKYLSTVNRELCQLEKIFIVLLLIAFINELHLLFR